MKAILRLAMGLMVPAALVAACGSSEKNAPTDGGTSTGGSTTASGGSSGTGGTTSASGGGLSTGGTTALKCDVTPCQKPLQFIANPTGCCQTDTKCGVSLAGQCLDPSVLTVPEGSIPNAEKIVPDAKCASLTLPASGTTAAVTLAGCCDQTGVCGVSTEHFPTGALGGFTIPTLCATSADTSAFVTPSADAAADVPCDYAKDLAGATDGGKHDGG